jgi:pseudaminic acid synthase
MTPFRIGDHAIGPGHPTFVVAEMSGNHNHDFDRAARIVEAAAKAGANAVKLQTYTPDTLTIDCDKPPFRVATDNAWAGKTLYELYKEAYTPWDWHPRLQRVAKDNGITMFSTPFDATSIEFLAGLDVPAYKVASFELVDPQLLRLIAARGKPVIMSTGMANLGEIHEAVEAIRAAGSPPLALLHCVSAYPAPPSEMNLATIGHLGRAFDVVTGLSDHTLSDTCSVLAVGQGASIIEKHFTLRRSDGGPDSFFSLEPEELTRLVKAVREAEQAIGTPHYERTPAEAKNEVFRRSLFVVRDVQAGEPFTAENVRSIRPGNGLPPKFLPLVLGRTARVNIERGTPMTWDHL